VYNSKDQNACQPEHKFESHLGLSAETRVLLTSTVRIQRLTQRLMFITTVYN
jgi:hypothetical protein